MLHVDPTGIEALEVADELLEPRWSLEGIFRENAEKSFSLRPQSGLAEVAGILDGLFAEYDGPSYQLRSWSRVPSSIGSRAASWRLSTSPGILVSASVSSMARQSSALTTTKSPPSRRTRRIPCCSTILSTSLSRLSLNCRELTSWTVMPGRLAHIPAVVNAGSLRPANPRVERLGVRPAFADEAQAVSVEHSTEHDPHELPRGGLLEPLSEAPVDLRGQL